MSKGHAIPLEQARALSEEVLHLLGDTITRGEIAGSVKRQNPTCGDLEVIVAASDNRVDELIDGLVQTGIFSKVKPNTVQFLNRSSWRIRKEIAHSATSTRLVVPCA